MLTGGAGIPWDVAIAGAIRPEYRLVEATLKDLDHQEVARPPSKATAPQRLAVDQAHFYVEIFELIKEWGYTARILPFGSSQAATCTPEEAQAAGVKTRHRVVGRTRSRLNRFRGLLSHWSKRSKNFLDLLHFACALLTYWTAGLP